MQLAYPLLLSAVALSAIPWCVFAGLSDEVIRSVLGSVKGGILVKNGKRTSCELGVVDDQGSYVAKDCLDYTKDKKINRDTKYEVYLDGGLDGKPVKHTVSNFTVINSHPRALANNFLFLHYNDGGDKQWNNMVSPVLGYAWDAVVYVRRSLRDMDSMVWDEPKFASLGTDYDQGCITMSGLFKANPSYFMCKPDLLPTPTSDLTPCPIPYGSVYGIVSRKAHLMGIHSFSNVVINQTMCTSLEQRSYYTSLHRYNNYANKKLGWKMDYDAPVFGNDMTNFPVDWEIPEKVDSYDVGLDIFVERGGFFEDQKEQIVFPPPAASSDEDSSIAQDEQGSADPNSSHDTTDKKRNAIIIGVCVGVGGFFIILGIILYVWWWRERHTGSVDPMSRNEYQTMLESDLGTLSVLQHRPVDRDILVEYDLPPVYDDPVDFTQKGPNSEIPTRTASSINTITQDTKESLLFLIARAYGATQPRLVSRDNLSLLSVVKGGMLVKNGNLTSCELAVIDNTVSITAASCLDHISPTVVDPNSLYFVYLDNGLDGRVAHYQVTNVTVHPGFNPTTHVNDIAILQYNNGADVKWQNAISPAPDFKWDQIGFVRVVPKDLGKQDWNGFKYDFINGNHDDTCDALSQIYTLNAKDMVCTGLTVNALSTNFSNCAIPLGTAYGLANNKAYIIGSYAYSAINDGDSFCSYVTQRSYYTLFANYMGFITATLGRQLTVDSDFFKVDMSKFNPDYRMADSELNGGNGLNSTIVGGDFYKNQIADSGIAPSLDEMMEPNPDDGEMGDLDSLSESEQVSSKIPEASSSEPAESSEGLSNKDTIIVAVCASLGGAVIIGLVLLVVLWYKRRRKEKKYPAGQSGYQDIIASEIGGAMVRRDSQAVSDFADTAPMQGSSSISTFRRISLIPHTTDSLYHNDMPPVYNEEVERANGRVPSTFYKGSATSEQ
ncbi:hypothetical protein EV183_003285 [Coemansia sp. RSA 2336]|nr:hypothetical protein EV183_003285 [Coemansia sp. RSA 2336]